MRTMAAVLMAIGLAAVGCKKDDGDKAADSPLQESAPPKGAADLWKLAPPDTLAAVVVREGSLARLASGVQTVRDAYRQVPGAIALMAELERTMPGVGEMVLDPKQWSTFGLDLSKPAAGFFLDGTGIVILPVGDRDAFVKTLGGASHDSGAARVDTIDDMTCKVIDDRYTCATDEALFAALGTGSPLIDRVAARGEAYRGDIEFDVETPDDPDFQGLYGAIILDPGAVTARARFRGNTSKWPPVFGGPASRVKKLAANPPAGFVRLHLKGDALAASADPSPSPFGPSQKDLVGALTGEILAYGLPGKDPAGAIEIGLADAGPVREAVAKLCPLLARGVPGVTASYESDHCKGTVSLRTLAQLAGNPMPIPFDQLAFDVSVADDAVIIGLGTGSGKGGKAVMGRAGTELLTGDWDLAWWGFGAMLTELIDPDMLQMISGEEKLFVISGLWAMLHLNEFGVGIKKTDDGLEVMLRVATQWANPHDVVAELEPLLVDAAQGKDVSAAMQALVAKHPKSPLGRSHDNAVGGMVPAVAAIGVTAAVAIPAFMKYQQKSKGAEARFMLDKMYQGARAYYLDPKVTAGSLQVADPSFPAQSTPITPPLGTCCAQGGKCLPDASTWTDPTWVQLQFSVDDPHYYSYQYEVAPDGRSFTVRAYGDLDCDGEYATFEMVGLIDPDTGEPAANAGLYADNETE
jgi:hypothetical protein